VIAESRVVWVVVCCGKAVAVVLGGGLVSVMSSD
jgi:hypothetical protein